MAKIGRNDPCICGSGKKYKHCHGSHTYLTKIQTAIPAMEQRAKAAQVQRQRQQGLGRPIISALTESGLRLVAVKNRLMHSKKWNTFADFLGDYIKTAFGSEWGNIELAKPLEGRHPILQWYEKVSSHQKLYVKEPGKISSAPMLGADQAYYHLAYDLYALDHNAELQAKLLARLRNHDNFWGARYEIAVAAMLIRAGFKIEFENEDDRSTRHCEFTATCDATGKKFSVEAKRRSGERPRMGHLLIDALNKNANHSRIVFVDVNLPDDGSEPDGTHTMNSAIRKLRGFEGKKINGQPLPEAYLIVTNFPWHHHLDSTQYRCCADIDGFQIEDFKANIKVPLRTAIEARERHIELHNLMQSMGEHNEVPMTFDGEISEFAFGEKQNPRLLIGQFYLIPDDDGNEQPAKLTSAIVLESEKIAVCGLSFKTGKNIISKWTLSDSEMSAWRKHPDTFFGEVGQRNTKKETPIELYDFFLDSYKKTPKERLLELLASSPDFENLKTYDQLKLASIYAERITLHAMSLNK